MMRLVKSLTLALLFFAFSQAALAQTPQQPAQPASAQQLLTNGQLDALVAPVALYPDALLSEILMASTYPLEVVEAERWAKANKALKADALKEAVDRQSWDDSVKSLLATPSVLDMMSERLSWTQQLGDAVLAQQADVMDAIQRLRAKAQANNKLASNKQQTVVTQQQGGKQIIVIAPTQPDTVYVPYYNPAVAYGPWPYPTYPPYYWPAPGYIAAGVVATGIAFGAGYALGRWVGGAYWRGGFNWGTSNINININRSVTISNINRGTGAVWVHNPVHRLGVRYSNADVAKRFSPSQSIASGAQGRMDFRGRTGQPVLSPGGVGGSRPTVGGGGQGSPGGVNRPTVGGGGQGSPGGVNRPTVGGGGQGSPGGVNRPTVGGGGQGSPGSGNRPTVGGGANRPTTGGGATRPSGGGSGAFGNIGSGRVANADAARGRASLAGGGGGARPGAGAAGGLRGGGGGGGGLRGGGRLSDVRAKHDITFLGHLSDGLGFYRFIYNGGRTAFVGVMAQEVEAIRPDAVALGPDGYLRVDYAKLGLKFETYDEWVASGARIPRIPIAH